MRTLIAVFLLVALLFVAAEGMRIRRRRTIAKCVRHEDTICRYVKKCVRGAEKCVARRTEKTCAKRGIKRRTVRKTVKTCLKYRHHSGSRDAGNICLKCKRWGKRTIKTVLKKAVCLKHHVRRVCTQRKRVCTQHRAVKRCHVKKHKYRMHGPKNCPAGYKMQYKRSGRSIRRSCKKITVRTGMPVRTCTSALDPHTTSFDGAHFEWQYVGDFVMAETTDHVFAVHQRLTRFAPTWTGTTGMAVMVNGRDVVQYLVGNHVTVNGKGVNITPGQQVELPEGGYMIKNGQTFSVFSPNGAHADFVDYGPYANLIVYVPTDVGVRGYCANNNNAYWMKNTASGLFNFRLKPRFVPGAVKHHKFNRAQRRKAEITCRAQGLTGAAFKNCVMDVLFTRGHPRMRKQFIRIEKHIKLRRAAGLKRRIHFARRVVRLPRRFVAIRHSNRRIAQHFARRR